MTASGLEVDLVALRLAHRSPQKELLPRCVIGLKSSVPTSLVSGYRYVRRYSIVQCVLDEQNDGQVIGATESDL